MGPKNSTDQRICMPLFTDPFPGYLRHQENMFPATDGNDGNGSKLEKIGPFFKTFQVVMLCRQKLHGQENYSCILFI